MIAIIGCGAITESFYLPGFARTRDGCRQLVLVDPATNRVQQLHEEWGTSDWATDHTEVLDNIQGAIIATPHHLHAPIGMDCLERGIHVLVEKPVATSLSEAQQMIETARATGAAIGVNQTRRLLPVYRKVKEVISSGTLGPINHLEYYEGGEFNWPTSSGFYFSSSGKGSGGVLFDRGIHVLDLICWWLNTQPELLSYHDDSFGGNEAVAEVKFAFPDGEGLVRLSWLTKRENIYRITCRDGILEGDIYDFQKVKLRQGKSLSTLSGPDDIKTFPDCARPLVENFIQVTTGNIDPIIGAEETLPALALIEQCYRERIPFHMPWLANGRTS